MRSSIRCRRAAASLVLLAAAPFAVPDVLAQTPAPGGTPPAPSAPLPGQQPPTGPAPGTPGAPNTPATPAPGAPAPGTPGTPGGVAPAGGAPAGGAPAEGTPAPLTPAQPSATAPTAAGVGEVAIPSPLTLAEAIRIGLRLQPDIVVAAADRQTARENLNQARARFLPTLSPQYTYIYNYTFVDVNRFTTGTGGDVIALPRSSTRETRQGDISLRYLIWDSGLRQTSARQAQLSLRASELGEEDTRQVVIGSVADNYFATLRAEALVRVSEAQVARAQNTLDVVRAQVEAGAAPRIDTLQAEADLANAQVSLLQARNNAEIAQARLRNAMGLVGGGRLTLADVPPPTPDTPTSVSLEESPTAPREATIADYTALAYRTRPDIARTIQSIGINQASVRLNQINAGLVLTTDTALGVQVEPNTGNNREISAQISYPLFDAGLSRARVRASQAAVRATEARVESLRQQVAVEVEQSFRTLAEARARVPAAQAAENAARINYQAAEESRREGAATIVDVITAQTLLVQAQTNLVQAIYDFYAADASLARAVGQAERLAQTR